MLGILPILLLAGNSFSFKHLGTTATTHLPTGFMAHTGEAMLGSCLPPLAVADEGSRYQDAGKCKEQ